MNGWAINVTAINDAETHLGAGTGNAALSASGVGTRKLMMEGQDASIAMQAAAVATMRKFGLGAGTMSASLVGRAILVIRGYGDADAELVADADGRVIPGNGGQAQLQLYADGLGRLAMRGDGVAPMVLVVEQKGNTLAATGAGLMAMDLAFRYGLPVVQLHPGFLDSVRGRRLSVDDDDRMMAVGADAPLRVRESRNLRVRRDRRT